MKLQKNKLWYKRLTCKHQRRATFYPKDVSWCNTENWRRLIMKAGIYDSEALQQRQKWIEGKNGSPIPAGTIDRIHIDLAYKKNLPVQPWGTYPDLPTFTKRNKS